MRFFCQLDRHEDDVEHRHEGVNDKSGNRVKRPFVLTWRNEPKTEAERRRG